MYRIAKQSLFPQVVEQLCQTRPPLLFQHSVTQVNVVLPDRIRFSYPDAQGRHAWHELEVQVLGENAHGVCFLTGTCHFENKNAMDAPNAGAGGDAGADRVAGNGRAVCADAFRLDLISGPVTRLDTGERMTLQDWERRVRRCFAMECKSDALPLSSMLIAAKSESAAGSADMPD